MKDDIEPLMLSRIKTVGELKGNINSGEKQMAAKSV